MAGPWEKYGGGSAPATSAPPAVIYGAPDPYKASSEARADRSAERQDAAAIRAAEASDRAAAAAQRTAENDARKVAAEERKLQAGGGIDATESERTAAFLATRVANGLSMLKGVGSGGDATIGSQVAESLPMGLGNFLTSEDRQRAAAAQLDVLDAALTLGTGAAYTREQLEGYRKSYFPEPGNDPATIADKQARLKVLLEAARVKAGSAAPAIDQALKNAGFPEEGLTGGSVTDTGGPYDPKSLSVAQLAELEDRGFLLNPQTGMYENRIEVRDGTSPQPVSKTPSGMSDAERNGVIGTIDAGINGFADTAMLGYRDEVAAGVDTVFRGGTMDNNLARQRALDSQDERINGVSRIAGQVAGGFALPTGAATGARGLATVGALYGAGYGSGSAEGSVGDRLIGAAKGAAGGAVVGGALGTAGRLIPRGGPPGGGGGNGAAVMQAGRELGITPMAADVGGPMTGRLTSGVAQTLGGAGPIMRGARRVQDAASDRLSRIAATEGTPVRQEVLGETAQRAAQGYIDESGRAGGELYREARSLAGNTRIQGRQALDTLDSNIAELGQTPNTSAAVIDGLSRFRDDLAVTLENGATARRRLPVDAIRALRTNVRAEAQTEGLRATDYQRRANQVLDSLSEDIASQLPADAQAAFRRADTAWRERLDTIDNVMEQVIGPNGDRSAEAVANRLINMSRGDSARLRTFVNSIGQEEAGVVRGSLIKELGRANSGQQGAKGDAFSLGGFLSNWDRLPERTRNLLFRGDNKQAIENLAVLAEGSRNAARFTNTSNTGGAVNAGNAIQSASAIAGWGSLGGSLVLENLTARMLASPAVARILARPPVDKARAIRRFAEAAVRDPAIAPDVARFTQALESGSNRAAAQEENQ